MNVIGIIPSSNQTFEVFGDFTSKKLVEGKLYYDPKDNRVYYYSKKETRSNPTTGYYPIWDGRNVYISNFSNKKYFDKDVTRVDLPSLCSNINKDVAAEILYKQRRSVNDAILEPKISDGDNMFTQCVKGVITAKQITMVDLQDMAAPKINARTVENYYGALVKISFMRLDKWNIWLDQILHVSYVLEVYKGEKKLLSYSYPSNVFDTGIVKYDNIISSSTDDPFKKVIKILIVMENITKAVLRATEVDDYTINNMMTTINGSKPLSAQLFSRFIRMAGLSYQVKIFDQGQEIFEYRE